MTPPTALTMSRKPPKSIVSQCSISSPVTSDATSASNAAPSSISPVERRPTEKTSLILPFCEKPLTPSIHRSRGIGIVVVVSVDGSIESTWIESAR